LTYSLISLLPLSVSLYLILFFLFLLPRPPTSTLFPYTTLFRSYTIAGVVLTFVLLVQFASFLADVERRPGDGDETEACELDKQRSEEHTSELQSRGHLVCRLLLEKKKKKKTRQSNKYKKHTRHD